MTIYGLHYRPAPYQPTPARRRIAALARLEFLALFRSRWGVAVYAACLFPSVVRLVMLLVWAGALSFGGPARGRMPGRPPQQFEEFVPTSARFYLEPILNAGQGLVPILILTAMVSSRAIAKDRTTNALELYWTRGITPLGYFAGKWFGSFLLIGTVTLLSPLALWVAGVLFAEDWDFLLETAGFMPRVLLGLAFFTAVMSLASLLFSAIASTPNLAMILWSLLLGGTTALANITAEVLRDPGVFHWLSLWEATGVVARALAGQSQRAASVTTALVSVVVVLGALAALARRRLRLQEAIG